MSVDQVGQFATINILCPRKVDLTICGPEATELLCCGVPRARVWIWVETIFVEQIPLGLEYYSLIVTVVFLQCFQRVVILLESTLFLDDELLNIGRQARFVRYSYLDAGYRQKRAASGWQAPSAKR